MTLDAGDSSGGSLHPGCPRCAATVVGPDPDSGPDIDTVECPTHGRVPTLWRPSAASYDTFGAHLLAADGFPTYLPWPVSPRWRVCDFTVVVGGSGGARASMTCCSGSSELDGPVDALIVAEEPGTGLGARCAGLPGDDPGPEVGRGPAAGRVHVGSQPVALWAVSTSSADPDFDRSVFVGEAIGRWLWLVLRPASAMLMLHEEWQLQDVAGMGPELVELAFGGPAPAW